MPKTEKSLRALHHLESCLDEASKNYFLASFGRSFFIKIPWKNKINWFVVLITTHIQSLNSSLKILAPKGQSLPVAAMMGWLKWWEVLPLQESDGPVGWKDFLYWKTVHFPSTCKMGCSFVLKMRLVESFGTDGSAARKRTFGGVFRSRNMGKKWNAPTNLEPQSFILGSQELSTGTVTVKDMLSGQQNQESWISCPLILVFFQKTQIPSQGLRDFGLNIGNHAITKKAQIEFDSKQSPFAFGSNSSTQEKIDL